MGPSVRWRRGGQQLADDLELLRFEVADINVVIKNACADSLHYGDDVVTPAGLGPGVGMLGSKAERAAARAELLIEFERVLELLGPIVDLDV